MEALREKEASIDSAKQKKWNENPYSTTINDAYAVWKELKRGVRDNTFRNYCYMYETYVSDAIGGQYIASVKKSDVKRFFNYLKDERNLKLGTIDGVHTVLHQVLQIAIQSILGHSDIATTMDIYTKATYKMVADAVILLENNSGCL